MGVQSVREQLQKERAFVSDNEGVRHQLEEVLAYKRSKEEEEAASRRIDEVVGLAAQVRRGMSMLCEHPQWARVGSVRHFGEWRLAMRGIHGRMHGSAL
jgi:hypothetical protein